ncbi:exo-alpha-sialidase [Shewanella baltica]|uniref:sialidase family protein n=1 Tax=Shewanella baltica TaxID=62322 RepID=UPI00217CEEE9|nr:sialidase family protein [Shewanella baltica]MCS6128879.1 exo-alpha-sialidase [Shewanella baltica]MCS6140809.1 exo-alpha-sialidase [Shewanella baltica]MCS6147093.1 exo-alpha-sialidase [Shewanella baltica]MCS6171622.1 exo-alpha-sialidase [Shewanella baltica]MCS6188847.1 exo-alpha-sialidase [Shewanella baltica]
MIIYQTIKDGFAVVNKTGAYFSLISAGGVVNVRLSEKGNTVLDTKMWVGMSIDKAIPFDEITITGDDGAVTFWAGDTSISGQTNVTIAGATAVRTKTVDVLGSKLLTLSDLTRQAIRVRTNKEVFLGGSGVNGTGWRLPAGVVEEFPIAGSLYAYKKLPELNVQNASVLNTYSKPTGAETASISNGEFHVSKDGNTILVSSIYGVNPFRISTDGGATWAEPAWANDIAMQGAGYYLVHHGARSRLFMLVASSGSTGSTKFFVSDDDGISFRYLITASALELVGIGYLNFSPYGRIVRNKLFFSAVKWWGLLDLESLTFSGVAKSSDYINAIQEVVPELGNSQTYNPQITSEDGRRIIGSISSPVRRTFASNDGGITWSVVENEYLSLKFDQTGDNVCGLSIYGSVYPYFSNDGGLSFVRYTGAGTVSNKPIVNFYNDIWIKPTYGSVFAFYIVNGEYRHDQGNVEGLREKEGYIINEAGHLITGQSSAAGEEMQRVELSVDGDLSPALVEIMELLS